METNYATSHHVWPRPSSSTSNYTIASAQHVAVGMRAIWPRARWTPPAYGKRTRLRAALCSTTSATEASDSQHDDTSLQELHSTSSSEWETVQRVAGMDLIDDQVLRGEEQMHSYDVATAAWNDLRYDSRMPGAPSIQWPANTGPDLVRYNLPPQSLWAPDTMRVTALRRRHTWKKLALQELSIALLIRSLLKEARVAKHAKIFLNANLVSPQLWDCASLEESQAEQAQANLLQHMENIHRTNVNSSPNDIAAVTAYAGQPAIPTYGQDSDGAFHAVCHQMNTSIKMLLNQVPKGDDRTEAIAVAKICHNLLISTAPPDVQTFNVLLIGFKRMRRPKSVDRCIAAFYYNKIRPNEITCREILEHYVSEHRPNDFSKFVARMRGLGGGIMLASPRVTINEASSGRLALAGEGKIYQKIHPTPMVFGSLIGGVLKFAGFDRALDIYYEMKDDGWGLDIHGLTRLLRDCVRRGDWEGGSYVWQEMSSIMTAASTIDMAKAYSHMLSLCSVTGNTVAFNQVLPEIANRGLDQKSIIAAATRESRRVHFKREYLAPAWAADNLLIAVSGYLDDAKVGANDDGGGSSFDLKSVQLDDAVPHPAPSTTDSKDAWASWVEHEFGEKPKEPEL